MILQQQLAELAAASAAKRGPVEQARMDGWVTGLCESGLGQDALQAGEMVPDFALPGADGRIVEFADVLARGPAVISFYRGSWCPYCNLELRARQQHLPEFNDIGATLVAISPELPDGSRKLVERDGLRFPVLSDTGNRVSRLFGLMFRLPDLLVEFYRGNGIDLGARNGDTVWELPVPATYVVGRDGVVAWAHVDCDYRRRAEPADVIAALRDL